MTTITKNRIRHLFEQKREDDKILSLFVTAGYPHPDETVDLMLRMAGAGADIIELGMPYSDPLADGPMIQYASTEALKQGIRLSEILEMVKKFREKSEAPVILMGYLNPVVHYGTEVFCQDAAAAGVDGLILPDLPPEDAGLIRDAAVENGLSMIFLAAPNTSGERLKKIDRLSDGFVYCVSVTGVTGARPGEVVASSVDRFIDRVLLNVTKNPVLIGFGIRNHDDALRVAAKARGYIVGSALIRCIREAYPRDGWKDRVAEFVSELKYGTPAR